jgi:hypothetical protein
MTEPYRTFHINGGVEPFSEALLGRITTWYATGCIDFRRPDHSVTELSRFRLYCLKFNDENVAKRFGLELARLFGGDFVIERYESEKRRIQHGRQSR